MVLVAGKMYRPTDVAFDIANNTVYVVEQFNHRISKWDYTDTNYDFTLDTTWGDKNPTDGTTGQGGPIGDGGPTDGNLYRPTGIVFDGTRLVVTDTFHNRIRTINSSNGAFIASTGQGGFGTADFYRPAGIAVNDAQTVLVIADELNSRAVRYTVGATPSAPAVLTDPSATTGLSFIRPHGVVYDVTNDFFNVTDSLRGLISRYAADGTGNILGQFGTPGVTGRVPAANDTELFFPGSGHGLLPGQTTTLFADTRNSSLKTITTETIAVTTGNDSVTAIPGTGNGQFYYPESVVGFVDAATNYVVTANTLNNRVEAFSNAVAVLTFQANFGSP